MAGVEDNRSNFYEELDRRAGRSCFSFTTLIIFLLIVLVAGSVGAIYLIRKARELPKSGSGVFPSQQAKEAVSQKIQELIKRSEAANTVTLELTEEELTTLLSESLAKGNLGKRFKQSQVELDPPLVLIRTLLVDPLRSQTVWYLEPQVEQGKLVARVIKVEAGKLTIPEFITSQFAADLSELLASFLPLTGRFEPTAVEVRRDILVITGRIK